MKESFGNDFNNEFKLKNDSKEYADVIKRDNKNRIRIIEWIIKSKHNTR